MSISQVVEDRTKSGRVHGGRKDNLVLPTNHREHAATRSTMVEQFGMAAPVMACANGRFDWLNIGTGEVVGEYCRRNTCLPCARRYAAQIALAIRVTRPTYMFTFTGLSGVWARDREAMNGVARSLRRMGGTVEWCYTVETNRDGRGAHAHGYLHGRDFLERLPDALASSGLGSRHDVRPFRGDLGTTYVFKEARHNQQSLDGFLRRNGGRLGNSTRNFWRSTTGAPASRKTVLDEARAHLQSFGDRWVRVPRLADVAGGAA